MLSCRLSRPFGNASRGMFVEAREPAERAFQLAPWNGTVIGILAGILACLGEQDRADELLAKIPETAPDGRIIHHLLRSETDAVADWCEKGIELRQALVARRCSAVYLKPLRDSPRWPKLARMMNLPE